MYIYIMCIVCTALNIESFVSATCKSLIAAVIKVKYVCVYDCENVFILKIFFVVSNDRESLQYKGVL
jgi:hypothetical protein